MSNSEANEPLRSGDCGYKAEHTSNGNMAEVPNNCECDPPINFQHCNSLFNPWLRNKLSRSSRKGGLIAYVRTFGDDNMNSQLVAIEDYCKEHGFKVVRVFHDHGAPGRGLQEALNAIDECAGIIAVDLVRFTTFTSDRHREIRPLIHHFLSHTDKHLITIAEGIDTRSPGGQLTAIELMNDNRSEV